MSDSDGNPPWWRLVITQEAALAGLLALLSSLVAHLFEATSWLRYIFEEISAALFVALFVWAFFEVISHNRQQKRIETLVQEIARGVFFGVLRRNLPPELLDEAKALILEAPVIRRNFSIHHTIVDAQYSRGGGQIVAYVKLRAVATFTYHNISERPVDVPIMVALPNPVQPELREIATVETFAIKAEGGSEEELDLKNAIESMRAAMANANLTQVKCEVGKRTVQPNQSLEVRAIYTMAKESEDTEVITALWPADGLRLTVHDTAPGRRLVNARSIHRTELVRHAQDTESGTYIFDLKSYILPHQGLVVWWKNRPDAN